MGAQTTLVTCKPPIDESEEFFSAIVNDIKKVPILLLSERGWGKSTALKTIIKRCKESHQDISVKIFDVSMSWFKTSPTKYRQLVTVEKIKAGQVVNVGDCIYEMGLLNEAQRRMFVGTIINQDYKKAYNLKLMDEKAFDGLPWNVYLFEEANTYFSSFSFRVKDWVSPVLSDFISVGRNYKLSAFLVATAEQGELAPSLRRRIRRIYGRLVAEDDIARVRRQDKDMANYLSKEIQRFNFIYLGDRFYGPVLIPDEVKTAAIDFPLDNIPVQKGGNPNFWREVFFGAVSVFAVWAFLSYFGVI